MSRRKSDSINDEDDAGLTEKYLHSQGAALYDEGRYDEAIGLFEKAVALDDQPYTHYHLCLAYIAKRDFEKALCEINEAIRLKPSVAKYYHRRSLILQSLGDTAHAAEDEEKALELDGNYAFVDTIRSTYLAIEQAFSNVEMSEWSVTVRPKHRGLESIIGELRESLNKAREAMETTSCALPCPAYCCHFEGETIRHGVHIGAWKLQAIRAFLKAKNISEEDYLGKIAFKGEEHLTRLVPPHHMVKERDGRFIYFPKRSTKALGASLVKHLPKGREYQELLWINEESKACAFLCEGRCMIHDLGGEPGLPSCKEFLCITGFIFAVLDFLGIVARDHLRTHSMARLNRLAIDALLILGRTLYGERLIRLGIERYAVLKDAARADSEGSPDEIDRCIAEYRRLSKEYQDLYEAQREEARREITERLR